MFYPLTVRDFIDRAETVYPDRVAVVDEPDQPAAEPGDADLPRAGRRWRARRPPGSTTSGCRSADAWRWCRTTPPGCSARSSASAARGGCWCRSTSASACRRSSTSSRTPAPTWCTSTPSARTCSTPSTCTHTFLLGDDDALYLRDVEPRPWDDPDEAATATINYTSGTTARPKGVQLTHRNLWLNATVFGLHAGVSDRDVYLHTLPMFHANGWGMPYVTTGLGVPHVVLRKVDGAEILRRVEQHGVTLMCAAPAVVSAALEAAGVLAGRDPRPRPGPHRRGRAPLPRPGPSSGSSRSWGGSSTRSTASPRPRRWSRSTASGPSGTTCRPTTWRRGWGARARPRSAYAWRSTRTARCSPRPTTTSTATGSSRRRPSACRPATPSTPATAATSTTRTATW